MPAIFRKPFFLALPLLFSLNCSDFSTGETLEGNFLPTHVLTVTSAISTDSNQLKIRFDQNLINTDFIAKEQFIIRRDDSQGTLIVSGFEFDEANPAELVVVTGFQFADIVYTLTIFGLEGEGGYSTPAKGIKTQFAGFNPIKVAREFRIITPPVSIDNKPFDITVDALNSSDFSFFVDMASELDISTNGNGTLTIEHASGWSAGSQTLTLRYNGDLAPLTIENIALSIKAVNNSGFNGLSNNITISSAIELDRFTVSAPAAATVNEAFAVTITAIGNDGLTFEEYDGMVSLVVIDAYSGNLDKITVGGFTDGVLQTDLTFSGYANGMKIRATATDDSSAQGESDEIIVGLGAGDNFALNLTGVGITGNKVRLSWQEVPGSFLYKVYRKPFGSGSYSEKASLSSNSRHHTDSGLTNGQKYEYKVTALDSGAAMLAEATTAVTNVGSCGTNIKSGDDSNLITTGEVWQKSDSPFCINNAVTITGSLLIEAGVTVLITSNESIIVSSGGALAAFGTDSEKIIFTSIESDPADGDWGQIVFGNASVPTTFDGANQYASGSGLKNVIIEYGRRALTIRSALSIERALIRYNDSDTDGGAIFAVLDDEKLIIRNSNISDNNVTVNGGAIVASGTGVSAIQIMSSVIENNLAVANGGAIHTTAVDLTVTNSFFRQNSAVLGGALYLDGGAHTVTDSNFVGNEAITQGGAIYNGSQLDITANLFQDNTALNNGGALFHNGGGDLNLTASRLQGNSASNSGGAIFISGVFIGTNNIFQENTAANGGAIFQNSSQMSTLTKTSFLANTASADGGALKLNAPQSRVVTNSLFQNNSAGADGGAVFLGDGVGVYYFTHNNIFNNTASGTGNNFQNEDVNIQIAGENYFGSDTSTKITMGICDGTASSGVCGAGTFDTNDPGGPVTVAWPLCTVDPGDVNCIGADF